MPSVEAHHSVNGPDGERNSGGRRIIKKKCECNMLPRFIYHSNSRNESLLQWGSDIWTSPDFKWLKQVNLQAVWILNVIWNPDKWLPFCKKKFEIWTKMYGFRTVCFWTIWKPDCLNFDRISDPHCIQMNPYFGCPEFGFPLQRNVLMTTEQLKS